MNANLNLILTSDNYFDSIEFQGKTEMEQVAYIMFYITEVAHLRKDMIADVIVDRIRDQYESFFQRNIGVDKSHYCPITKEQVENILNNNPAWFQKVKSGVFAGSDRSPKMKSTPYRLTDLKKEELWKLFDKDIKSKIDVQKKRLLLDKSLLSIFFVICFCLSVIYIINKYRGNDELVVTPIQSYTEKINFAEYNFTKKGVLFVYYVTELTKMRNEVNATAIHDRIIELGYEIPPTDEFVKLLDNTEMLESLSQTPKAYSLTDIGINYAEDVVNSHIKKDVSLILSWDIIIALLTGLFSLLCFVIKVSYAFGKQQ